MSLTAHIPLPDPARGALHIDYLRSPGGVIWKVYQYAFSNRLDLTTCATSEQAQAIADELTTRMAVHRALTIQHPAPKP